MWTSYWWNAFYYTVNFFSEYSLPKKMVSVTGTNFISDSKHPAGNLTLNKPYHHHTTTKSMDESNPV